MLLQKKNICRFAVGSFITCKELQDGSFPFLVHESFGFVLFFFCFCFQGLMRIDEYFSSEMKSKLSIVQMFDCN